MEENRNSVFESEDSRHEVKELFYNLKKQLPNLKKLFIKCSDQWGYEDPIYRFFIKVSKSIGFKILLKKL